MTDPVLTCLLGALGTLGLGALVALWRLPILEARLLDRYRDELKREAEVVGRERSLEERAKWEQELDEQRRRVAELEERGRKREDALDKRIVQLDEREGEVGRREARVKGAEAELEVSQAEVAQLLKRQLRELERISELQREEAEHLLLDRVERRCQAEAEQVLARADEELADGLERRARDVLLTAVQRLACRSAHESLVSVVQLPDDELKGVLIGRDGRNIRAFEERTGVDLLVDDTPGLVVVSGFDPVRREVARRALVRLLGEGRIHPPRIEAVVAEVRQEMEGVVVELGQQAASEAGVSGLSPRLVPLLGRLEFCSSEGQNVRVHSVETAHLAATLASELGLDPDLARRCGLLHDIGKAVDHDTDGSHERVGAVQAERCEEDPRVVNAILAHHGEVEASSPYAAVVEIANRLSSERPGARDGQIEAAIRRREELERIAERNPGVRRAYAVQAGRHLRLVVDPERVSHKAAQRLAREVAREVEASSGTLGAIQVTVVREERLEAQAE
jgi:ribonucrease Y